MTRQWMEHAACLDTPTDLFFPEYENGNHAEQQARIDQAKRVCWGCVVRPQCRQYAWDHKITDGVWGGVNLSRSRKKDKEEAA